MKKLNFIYILYFLIVGNYYYAQNKDTKAKINKSSTKEKSINNSIALIDNIIDFEKLSKKSFDEIDIYLNKRGYKTTKGDIEGENIIKSRQMNNSNVYGITIKMPKKLNKSNSDITFEIITNDLNYLENLKKAL